MLAGVLCGRRDLQVQKIPRPQLRSGQVLLRVRRVGVCGSDVHYYLHGRCGRFVPTRPFILGHEFVAIIEEIGPGVKDLAVGQRVVVNPAGSCGHCEACRIGRGNLCEQVVMLGSASTVPPTDGALAEYVAVSAHQCYVLPDGVDDKIGAMIEPLSVSLHAIRRAGGVAGARVVVFGGGPIGLITALAARTCGASVVAVSEPNQSRRELAKHFSAEHALDPTSGDFIRQVLSVSDGGFDVVVEASGAAAAVRDMFSFARRGAAIVQIGTVGDNDVMVPVNDLLVRELTLLGSFRYSNEFADAIRLVSGARIDLAKMVTSVFPLTEVPRALESASAGSGELKVQVIVSD